MGIFDRGGAKKPQDQKQPGAAGTEEADYFDSPVETVSLKDAPQAVAPVARAQAAGGSAKVQVSSQDEDVRPAYGIENAIQLMRALPVDQNVELVVAVIKGTLESLKVKVSDIIDDASKKQKDLEGRIGNLKQAIADFEKEIHQRKEEIARIEADHAETTAVKGRLELAERAQTAQAQTQPPKAMGAMGAKG
jgi:hypothetical protein